MPNGASDGEDCGHGRQGSGPFQVARLTPHVVRLRLDDQRSPWSCLGGSRIRMVSQGSSRRATKGRQINIHIAAITHTNNRNPLEAPSRTRAPGSNKEKRGDSWIGLTRQVKAVCRRPLARSGCVTRLRVRPFVGTAPAPSGLAPSHAASASSSAWRE